MEDPRGSGEGVCAGGGGLRPALFLCLPLWGNRRPFNQTAEIEKQTRTLIIQRRKERGGKLSQKSSASAWHFARTPFDV